MRLEDIIRQYRYAQNLSMQEFADKCGLSKGYISMLEKGRHPQNNRQLVPSLNTIRALAAGMDLPVDSLLAAMDGDSVISVNDPEPVQDEFELTYNEQQLIRNYRDLNQEGKEKLLDFSEDLVSGGRYKKAGQNASNG